MKHALTVFAAALIALGPMTDAADAKGKNKNKGKSGNSELSIRMAPGKVKIKVKGPVLVQTGHCPPGLAKKDPPCIPPGLVRGAPVYDDHVHDHYVDHDPDYFGHDVRTITEVTNIDGDVIHVGDVFYDGRERYVVLQDPDRFGLPPLERADYYVRVGDAAVRLDSETQRIITILALADLLIK